MKMKQRRTKVQNHTFSLKQILNGVIITKLKKMLSTAKEREETKLTKITQKTVYLKKMNIVRGKSLENTFKTLIKFHFILLSGFGEKTCQVNTNPNEFF